MHGFSEWLLLRKKARRTKPEWGLLRERRSTCHHWGWGYIYIMPFSDLWHASPVSQKEDPPFLLPPADLIQSRRAARGSSRCVIACSWCWKMSVVHTCLHHITETSPAFALEDTCIMHQKRWALHAISALLILCRTPKPLLLSRLMLNSFFTCISLIRVS